jgi:hypothetical protein
MQLIGDADPKGQGKFSFIASGARVLTDLLLPLKNGLLVLLELSA